MNVLLAIDGSEPATRAVQLVGRMPWPRGSTIRVLAVIPPAFDPTVGMPGLAISPDVVEEVAAAVEGEAERTLSAAVSVLEAEGRAVERLVMEGRPATAIVHTAKEVGADLIVLGSHGRAPLATSVLGSVSAEVAEAAPCSVLVVRGPNVARLVLADDGSEHSEAARHLVATMPGFRGLHVRVVSVLEHLHDYVAWLAPESVSALDALKESTVADRRALTALVERQAGALNDAGLVATGEVREGDPGTEIVAVAAARGDDLIVMGSRGRTRLASIILGSVSRKVLSRAPCSVLVVRHRTG